MRQTPAGLAATLSAAAIGAVPSARAELARGKGWRLFRMVLAAAGRAAADQVELGGKVVVALLDAGSSRPPSM